MVAEVPGTGATAQQAVDGGHLAGDFLPYVVPDIQALHLLADGFGQTCRRLAGRCCETDAQRLATLYRRGLQQGQQAHHRGGFAGARATGDDAETLAGRQRAGKFLPVDHSLWRSVGRTEQRVEPLRQILRRRFTLGQALTQGCSDTPFVSPVATQVQTPLGQHQWFLSRFGT